jgi:hypothetical protein
MIPATTATLTFRIERLARVIGFSCIGIAEVAIPLEWS